MGMQGFGDRSQFSLEPTSGDEGQRKRIRAQTVGSRSLWERRSYGLSGCRRGSRKHIIINYHFSRFYEPKSTYPPTIHSIDSVISGNLQVYVFGAIATL